MHLRFAAAALLAAASAPSLGASLDEAEKCGLDLSQSKSVIMVTGTCEIHVPPLPLQSASVENLRQYKEEQGAIFKRTITDSGELQSLLDDLEITTERAINGYTESTSATLISAPDGYRWVKRRASKPGMEFISEFNPVSSDSGVRDGAENSTVEIKRQDFTPEDVYDEIPYYLQLGRTASYYRTLTAKRHGATVTVQLTGKVSESPAAFPHADKLEYEFNTGRSLKFPVRVAMVGPSGSAIGPQYEFEPAEDDALFPDICRVNVLNAEGGVSQRVTLISQSKAVIPGDSITAFQDWKSGGTVTDYRFNTEEAFKYPYDPLDTQAAIAARAKRYRAKSSGPVRNLTRWVQVGIGCALAAAGGYFISRRKPKP